MKRNDSREELDALLTKSLDSNVPPEVEARLRGRLAAFREKMESPQADASSRKETTIMSLFRKSGSAKVRWAAASLVVAVAVALLVVLNPWGQGPARLYAEAVERIQTAGTMTVTYYSEALTFSSLDNVTPGTMEIACKEPAHFRMTFESGWYVILDHGANKGIMVYPNMKMYDEMDFTQNPAAGNVINDLRSLPDRADEVLEQREMDGRTVQGYRVDRLQGEEMKNAVVWVDVKTGDPVRIEGEYDLHDPNDPTGQRTRTINKAMSNFRFGVELDDALFDTTPPEGYSVGPRTRSRVDPPPVEKDE